ncbi:MAG: hypothetical protein O7G32_12890 [SAR324 cluster bacterium]|nr:hypothetical protein [SAR324 cluster bacterium]
MNWRVHAIVLAFLLALLPTSSWPAQHSPSLQQPPGSGTESSLAPEEGADPDLGDKPFLSAEENEQAERSGAGEDPDQGERARFSFDHRYRVEGRANETTGLLNVVTGTEKVQLLQIVQSYQQTIRIESSSARSNFVRFAIDFTQSYEAESGQFIDNQLLVNEIYHNIRSGNHQVWWGNQIFKLGKVDFGSPIDVLHIQNLFALMTFDAEAAKQSVLSLKYEWAADARTFTLFAAPVGQRTFGMKFTRFREDSRRRDAGENPEGEFLLRDFIGLQHQWEGQSVDLRIGLFHWFDRNPKISWQFKRPQPGVNTFQGFFDSFKEEEAETNFVTFEMDAKIGSVGWKLDVGYFDKKNFYDYRVTPPNEDVNFDTVSVPYLGAATSLESSFANVYLLGVYSFSRLEKVPPNSHILFFENEPVPSGQERDLASHTVTGVLIWNSGPNSHLKAVLSQSEPYSQLRVAGEWGWGSGQAGGSQWALRLLHLKTEILKISGTAIESNQISFGYTVNFAGLSSD